MPKLPGFDSTSKSWKEVKVAIVPYWLLFQDQMGQVEQQELAFVSESGTIQVSSTSALRCFHRYLPSKITMVNFLNISCAYSFAFFKVILISKGWLANHL